MLIVVRKFCMSGWLRLGCVFLVRLMMCMLKFVNSLVIIVVVVVVF